MLEYMMRLDDGIREICISYEDGFSLSIEKEDFDDSLMIEKVMTRLSLENALEESIKDWNDAKERFKYTGDIRAAEHVIYFAAWRDALLWILKCENDTKLCDDIGNDLNVMAVIRLMESGGKHVTFKRLRKYFENDIDDNTLSKILEKNCDLGIIDGRWQMVSDKWYRTFTISPEALDLIDSLIKNKNLKLIE